ncbi:hypothetical protein Hanom_Chr09g00772801 [Helianthus anomalus]
MNEYFYSITSAAILNWDTVLQSSRPIWAHRKSGCDMSDRWQRTNTNVPVLLLDGADYSLSPGVFK